MRIIQAVFGLAAVSLAFASPAQAEVAPISFSPEFQTALEEDLGPREGEFLSNTLANAVNRELNRRGVSSTGPIAIEITIVDADPNQPTIHQTRRNLSLDIMRSVSLGGAELHAVLRGADGQVLREVNHRRYNRSLEDMIYPPGTWAEARRAINQFARKVADAYVAVS